MSKLIELRLKRDALQKKISAIEAEMKLYQHQLDEVTEEEYIELEQQAGVVNV